MFNFFEKKDTQIEDDVVNELRWNPSVQDLDLIVKCDEGIITLRGNVPHFYDKTLAEEIALGVGGVKAVANEIEVVLMGEYRKNDSDIAKAALEAIEWNYAVPKNIKFSVTDGVITLSGEVEWDYQRLAAKNVVKQLMGVSGVNNNITITPKAQSKDVKALIENALKRSAEVEGRKINVEVKGENITLTGKVHSFWEVMDAVLAAWNAPGVRNVDNKLRIA